MTVRMCNFEIFAWHEFYSQVEIRLKEAFMEKKLRKKHKKKLKKNLWERSQSIAAVYFPYTSFKDMKSSTGDVLP